MFDFTIEEIEKKIDEFSQYNDFRGAFGYYKVLAEFIKNNSSSFSASAMKKYNDSLMTLKFLALENFDNWEEIKRMIKEHYDIASRIKYYDLWRKIKINLLTEPLLPERDRIKGEIKNILLNCNRPLIDRNKYSSEVNLPVLVSDWLRDYNANLGVGKVDKLKKIEYFTNGKNLNKLDAKDRERIKNLFDFYERLKYSSEERYGFDEDVPMIVDGKFVIFSEGEAEIIGDDIKNLIASMGSEDKNIDFSKKRQSLATPKSPEEQEIETLEKMAAGYALGSLERRAVEEEIRKMKLSIRYQGVKK